MERTEILNKIETILSSAVETDNFEFSENLVAKEVAGLDSVAIAMIITSIEQDFGIKFKFAEIVSWKTFGELADIIQSKLS